VTWQAKYEIISWYA